MFVFPGGRWPLEALRARLVPLAAPVAALALAGCATDNNTYNAAYAGSPPAYVAERPAVEMEADGMPAQAAPAVRIRSLPDDPSEPFSPNYGGSNPANVRAEPVAQSASNEPTAPSSIPADLSPAFRHQLVAAVETAG